MNKERKKILILSDYYLPGYKSGGGMRTIVNMADRLNNLYDFFIITRDHDGKLDRKQYETVKINNWNKIRGAEVFYLSKKNFKISTLQNLIVRVNPDLIYCNSYFSTLTFYLLILKKLRRISDFPTIIAPCGELSDGALQLNTQKKKIYVELTGKFKLYQKIVWKASSELEVKEIEKIENKIDKIFIAPDMLPKTLFENFQPSMKPPKIKGEVKMVFLSRFMKKKNFKWLLENLNDIRGKLEIDIYGPLEDSEYWDDCRRIIKKLPENIKIRAKGAVPHEQVLDTLVKYHFFIMPTLGENFGHIFLEAMAAGCPLIISDRTPWVNLSEKNIGWDLPLEIPNLWNDKINKCIELTGDCYSQMSIGARNYSLDIVKAKKIEQDTLTLLEFTLGK